MMAPGVNTKEQQEPALVYGSSREDSSFANIRPFLNVVTSNSEKYTAHQKGENSNVSPGQREDSESDEDQLVIDVARDDKDDGNTCISTTNANGNACDKTSVPTGLNRKSDLCDSNSGRIASTTDMETEDSVQPVAPQSEALPKRPTPTLQKGFICGLCRGAHATFNDLAAHMEVHKQTPHSTVYTCANCKRVFCDSVIYQNHMTLSSCCNVCQSVFGSSTKLHQHKLQQHKQQQPKPQQPKPQQHNCSLTFTSRAALRQHLWSRHAEIREARGCEICGEACERASCLAQHKLSHRADGPYACDVCSEPFADMFNFFQHMNTHRGGEHLHVCPVCTVAFIQESALLLHMTSHNREKPYGCKICGAIYASALDLADHEATHSGHGSFVMEVFRLAFDENARGPVKRAQLERVDHRYMCDICFVSFESPKAIANHVVSHENDSFKRKVLPSHPRTQRLPSVLKPVAPKPTSLRYKCSCCDLIYNDRNQMLNHTCMKRYKTLLRVADQDNIRKKKSVSSTNLPEPLRPYKCDLCPAAFTTSGSLTTHTRTHTGERPFTCALCKSSFIDRSTLTKHTRVHTGERPYKCDVCDAAFTQSGNLLRHIRLLHLEKKGRAGLT
ncbi:PREDICTED: endothelial zinc finger protein induced by tumor necrosis factor alpha-like [Priapulus caudatus]|uniref:Endothelial zinc finger protein induced by tumor necrosis factor alpha-like n=1 Tax=Priapulus caudatus TaxID=37621 RepID=A0ABM1E032_PRICU|nr:PREDICTED: endothelial zinc finger protein induced by tumor necrosis factor alpha-like [Priapulus caudatus]